MRFFLDTEFIESGPDYPIVPLSIGVAAEDNTEFYAEFEVPTSVLVRANSFVRTKVLPLLTAVKQPRDQVARDLLAWLTLNPGKPEFWGYFADYDWVLFCQLFGTMATAPKGLPHYCLDLKQEMRRLGVTRAQLPKPQGTKHHALTDALWHMLIAQELKLLENNLK